jgi:hypothetical protein
MRKPFLYTAPSDPVPSKLRKLDERFMKAAAATLASTT